MKRDGVASSQNAKISIPAAPPFGEDLRQAMENALAVAVQI